MSDFDKSVMTFSYSGFGRNIHIKLDGEEADYLPKVMATFAEFCRSVGFTWVSVDQLSEKTEQGYTRKNYLFRGNYKWDDSTDWAETYHNTTMEDFPQFDESDDEQPEEVNEAADNYYGFTHTSEPDVGDTVYYHGHGTENEKCGHGGYTNVPLLYLIGTVVNTKSTPLGMKALVRWKNWNDGHNGLGDDPKARIKDANYFWVFMDNLELTTD